jgi:hypothetical protein
MEYFTVIHEASNLSEKVKDFTTPSVPLDLLDSEYLYVGYRKPFNTFFCEVSGNIVANTFTAEAWVNGAWVAVDILDESEGFTESGFLQFTKPTEWAVTTVAGEEKYFIRLSPSASHTAGSLLTGLAVLFSNDLDLIGVRDNIVSKHNNGKSWVAKHEASRKYIIQEIRNKGNKIVQSKEGQANPFGSDVKKFIDVTEYDILKPFQLRQASLYKTLSMIYLDELHDEENDKWQRQGLRYEAEFYKAIDLFFLSIDSDDDGKESSEESRKSTGVNLSWQ